MAIQGFDYGRCRCYGLFQDRFVEVRIAVGEKVVVLTRVPQGICNQCSAKVYRKEVLERIEMLAASGQKPKPPPAAPPPPTGPGPRRPPGR